MSKIGEEKSVDVNVREGRINTDQQLRYMYWNCTGTGTTIRTPNFKLDFFQEQRLLEEKNDIGTKITMLNLLPGQVLHFPAKGTY